MKKITVFTRFLVVFGVGILFAGSARGQVDATAEGDFRPKPDVVGLSSELAQVRDLAVVGKPLDGMVRADPYLRMKDGRVSVSLRCERVDEALLRRLAALGLQVENQSAEFAMVTGWCDPAVAGDLAALPGVSTVSPNYRPVTWTGSVTSQADATMRAVNARAAFGVDGTGITVGVLSDSFNNILGGTVSNQILTGAAPQVTGDLPSSILLVDDGPGGGADEGSAMAELIYDLAPGVDFVFHTAYRDEINFATGIVYLANQGADVLVDDVSYFAEPFYQDGFIAQAITSVVDSGAVYCTSAGNLANNGARTPYVDLAPGIDEAPTTQAPTGVDFQAWAPGDGFADITVPANGSFTAVLQWNQPFSGALGPGSEADLDLYLFDAASPFANVVGFSNAVQGTEGNPLGDPVEIAGYANFSGSSDTVYLAVDHYLGVRAGLEFRIILFLEGPDTGWGFQTGIFDKSPIFGHQGSAEAITVAAAFYGEIDSGGTAQAPPGVINVEEFSSLGGLIPYYFDGGGNPLPGAPVFRFKPEVTAADGTNTTFFGADIGADPDSFPNFFGTSASAPQVAGVAALMLDRSGALTPGQVRSVLQSTAQDIEAPGQDDLSGDGFVDALDAVGGAILPTPTPTPPAEAGRWEVR